MNLKTIIVEDDITNQKNLKQLLKNYCPFVEVIGVVDSEDTAVEAIQQQQPDLLFLDIELKSGNGFKVLEKVIMPDMAVIFTTVHNQYAVKAFKYAAMDYLLKPISVNELTRAVEQAKDNKIEKDRLEQQLEELQKKKPLPGLSSKIAIASAEGYDFVPLNQILLCEASNNYTIFRLVNGEQITSSKTLKFYEEIMDKRLFFRVSKSHLVNTEFIAQYKRSKRPYVTLRNGQAIRVSHSRKEALLKQLIGR